MDQIVMKTKQGGITSHTVSIENSKKPSEEKKPNDIKAIVRLTRTLTDVATSMQSFANDNATIS